MTKSKESMKKYSRNGWKQLLQRIQEIPEKELKTDDNGNMIQCRKHTNLVLNALRDTARDTGHIAFLMFLTRCK